MGFWNKLVGGGVKEAADGVKTVTGAIGDLGHDLRSMITGEMKPETKAALETLALKVTKAGNEAQQALSILEAGSGSFFIAAWRPAIGWVCALSLFMYFPFRYIVEVTVWVVQSKAMFDIAVELGKVSTFVMPVSPSMEIGQILGLVASLLGMASLRTYEKKQKVAR